MLLCNSFLVFRHKHNSPTEWNIFGEDLPETDKQLYLVHPSPDNIPTFNFIKVWFRFCLGLLVILEVLFLYHLYH